MLPKDDRNAENTFETENSSDDNQDTKSDFESSEEEISSETFEEYESAKVKLRWSRVLIVASVLALFFVGVTLLVLYFISKNNSVIFLYLPTFYLIECGLLLTFGGCVGTVRQSFTIDAIKHRLVKGEKITGADTKIAIGSAYTYIIAGFLIGFASFIAWLVV